ncbi:hypothetical protein CEXT_429421 [Caerostris extrusa]|uniref:Uncharacterized protein n=1 Tax=Caerostris extrusa TaxID=172846 RepID=A0AAV4T0N1_CAEEX|nr:hypothetical protein CEXT_429421 [Caerostris extrusa]
MYNQALRNESYLKKRRLMQAGTVGDKCGSVVTPIYKSSPPFQQTDGDLRNPPTKHSKYEYVGPQTRLESPRNLPLPADIRYKDPNVALSKYFYCKKEVTIEYWKSYHIITIKTPQDILIKTCNN